MTGMVTQSGEPRKDGVDSVRSTALFGEVGHLFVSRNVFPYDFLLLFNIK